MDISKSSTIGFNNLSEVCTSRGQVDGVGIEAAGGVLRDGKARKGGSKQEGDGQHVDLFALRSFLFYGMSGRGLGQRES